MKKLLAVIALLFAVLPAFPKGEWRWNTVNVYIVNKVKPAQKIIVGVKGANFHSVRGEEERGVIRARVTYGRTKYSKGTTYVEAAVPLSQYEGAWFSGHLLGKHSLGKVEGLIRKIVVRAYDPETNQLYSWEVKVGVLDTTVKRYIYKDEGTLVLKHPLGMRNPVITEPFPAYFSNLKKKK